MKVTACILGIVFFAPSLNVFADDTGLLPIDISAGKAFEHLPPVVTVDKVIPVGSNFVAFNPNHGDAKVITKLAQNDTSHK